MSESNEDKNINSKKQNNEQTFNLVKTILDEKNKLNKNQQPNFINPLHNQQNSNINKSKSNSNNTNGSITRIQIQIMNDMKNKIDHNDYESIKKLLKESIFPLQSKNVLLNLSFNKYNLINNIEQRKIILELINHGADPNHNLNFEINDKTKNNFIQSFLINTNIKINPLLYCCLTGDYELFEILKNKVNLSTNNEENISNHSNNLNKNYFFYFFENDLNMENKYKIAYDILLLKNKNNNIKININDYDKQTGLTLLMISVKMQYINFINLFLDNDADINKQNLIDGNTALHYAALVKNKEIIELFLKNKNCNLLIKNNNKETIVDVASKTNSTEIYTLLASKYTEQQQIYEDKKSKEENIDYNYNKNNRNNLDNYHGYNNMIINNNIEESDETKGSDEGLDIIKKNQVNNNIEELSSYLEIPFQFDYHPNYNNYYDSNNLNNFQNNNSNYGQNDINNKGNIRNYLRFNSTPILNINLKTEKDEDLLILDNLKKENDEYDYKFEQIEKSLEQVYNEHSKLLKELSKVNNDIKSAEIEMEKITRQIKENENKNLNDINKINIQKNAENSALDILLSQENFINLKKCHEILLNDEEYLNKKFSDEIFDDNQIKVNLTKDIIDFQKYNKSQIKQKSDKIYSIRSSLHQVLEFNKYDYNVYIFGSYATGLSLPWSDLDLILVSKNQNIKNDNTISILQEIKNLLNNENWIFTPNLITDYAFPYITFSTDEKHGFIKVNLTIQDNKNNGYKSVNIIQDFLKSYKNLEPLTLIIKQLMKCSNTLFSLSNYSINNSSETLNSYSIILMIVYYLQFKLMGRMDRTVEMINNPDNLGELFINFLLYYINYDYNEKNYIFVRTGLKDSIESDDYLYLNSFRTKLIIIDPLDHKNNVSLKTGDFRNIPIIFKLTYYSSKVKCDCSCHYLKTYNKNEEKKNYNNNKENKKYVDLGTQHCILKKIFQTAFRINSNVPKVNN